MSVLSVLRARVSAGDFGADTVLGFLLAVESGHSEKTIASATGIKAAALRELLAKGREGRLTKYKAAGLSDFSQQSA